MGHLTHAITPLAGGASLIAGLAAILAAAAPSQASETEDSTVDLAVCTVSVTASYDPGLLLTERQTTVASNRAYTACVTTAPGVTSGQTAVAPFQATTGCLSTQPPRSVVETITWNTGQTSELTVNMTVTTLGGQNITARTGSVTDGLFVGATVQSIHSTPTINLLDCLAEPGVTSKGGVGELTITGVS